MDHQRPAPDLPSAVNQVQDLIDEAQEAIKSLDQQLEVLAEQARPIRLEKTRVEVRLKLLKEILSTYQVEATEEEGEVEHDPSTIFPPAVPMRHEVLLPTGDHRLLHGRPANTSDRVRSQVKEILDATDGPMHINQIHHEFVARGWPVPGAGHAGNITAHLTRAPDIRSPQRAYYEIGPNDLGRKPRGTRTRSRKKTK